MSSPKKVNKKDQNVDTHKIQFGGAGGIQSIDNVSLGKDGSKIPAYKDVLELYHRTGSHLRMATGATLLWSHGDMAVDADGDLSLSSKGNKQDVVLGNNRVYTHGDSVFLTGVQLNEQREAATKLQETVSKIEKAKIDKIKSTKGTEVGCPTCEKEYLINKKSGFISRVEKTVRKYTPPYFGYPVDILFWVFGKLVSPKLDKTTGNSMLGGTCGNKGCKNGIIESAKGKLDAGNAAAVQEAERQSATMDQHASKLKGGNHTMVATGDVILQAGLVPNNSDAFAEVGYNTNEFMHELNTNRTYFTVSGAKNSKKVANTNPSMTIGNMNIIASNKLFLNAGSPGLEILTKGQGNLQFGGVSIIATDGELLLTSNNVTTIKGKNLILDADDRTGTGGIQIRSRNTLVGGALHVNGNSSTIGSVSIDGNLSAPFLITRSMRLQTAKSGSTKVINNAANWAGTAQAMEVADKVVQTINKYVMPGNLLDPDGIFTLALETWNSVWQSSVIEFPVPTGLYFGGCANAAGPGVSWGYVWNYKHSHNLCPQSHNHDHTVPMGKYFDDRESWAQARTDASSIPTSSHESGDAGTPGPKSNGGACGGGGFGFGSPNSNASQARIARNARFGIIGDDAFGDNDFVNVIPEYEEDGNVRNVGFSLQLDCPSIEDLTPPTDSQGQGQGQDGIRDC
jgi:hypothetical protein